MLFICCRINNNSNETLTYTFFREDELNTKSKKRQPHLAKFSDDECIHHDTSAQQYNESRSYSWNDLLCSGQSIHLKYFRKQNKSVDIPTNMFSSSRYRQEP